MKFHLDRCLQLQKELKNFRKYGGTLASWDRNKFSELNKYYIVLHDNIYWQTRFEYNAIIDSFVKGELSSQEFLSKYSFLNRQNRKKTNKIEKNLNSDIIIDINSKSVGFTKILSSIQFMLDLFDSDLSDLESTTYGISENTFKKDLQYHSLVQLQKYCNEE
jgi:hypothetical protein